jgi:hypothetical protein
VICDGDCYELEKFLSQKWNGCKWAENETLLATLSGFCRSLDQTIDLEGQISLAERKTEKDLVDRENSAKNSFGQKSHTFI